MTAKTNSSRSIIVYWNATKEPGNGIVGHRVLYNRKGKPAREKYWSSKDIWNATLYQTTLEGLNPNREYEVRVYPRSHAMYGVVSNTATAKTLADGKNRFYLNFVCLFFAAILVVFHVLHATKNTIFRLFLY